MKLNKSTLKTIDILNLVATGSQGLTITEISQQLAIPKSTTYQILQTLVEAGILEVDRNKTFRFGLRFYEIALPACDQMDLRREARPIMEDLCTKTGESIHMATHDKGQIVYLEQVEGPALLRISAILGSRGPMHCTAMGKAILAGLPEEEVRGITGGGDLPLETANTIRTHDELLEDLREVRYRGYAIDEEELLPDIACVAAPIFSRDEIGPIAAVTIVGHHSRMPSNRIAFLGKQVIEAALKISRRLGYKGDRPYTIYQGERSGTGNRKSGASVEG
ncbi:MAG: IclR family transcriptional regulator [Chlorobiales bacterium]|nr:IclR family transcriptional regulator [Chlorobiales bacterium]